MARYINADALLQDIGETVLFSVRGGIDSPTPEMRGAKKVINRINAAPTVDVEKVRHGAWKFEIHSDGAKLICTECQYNAPYELDVHRYCPRCGAKMDGGNTE